MHDEEDDEGEPWARQMMTRRMQERLAAYRKFLEEWKEYEGDDPSESLDT